MEGSEEIIEKLRKEFEPKGIEVFSISAVSGQGVKELLYHVQELLKTCPEEVTVYEPEFDPALRFFSEEPFTVEVNEEGEYVVEDLVSRRCWAIPILIPKRASFSSSVS